MKRPPATPAAAAALALASAVLGFPADAADKAAPGQAATTQALQARVLAARDELQRAQAAVNAGAARNPAAAWTNWPKWSKWSNWGNK